MPRARPEDRASQRRGQGGVEAVRKERGVRDDHRAGEEGQAHEQGDADVHGQQHHEDGVLEPAEEDEGERHLQQHGQVAGDRDHDRVFVHEVREGGPGLEELEVENVMQRGACAPGSALDLVQAG